MAGLAGQFFGAVIGMALFGSIVALILRKFFRVPTNLSFIAGLAIMLGFAVWSSQFNGSSRTMSDTFFLYGTGAILAYFVMVALDGRSTGPTDLAEDGNTKPPRDFRALKRGLAWTGFVLLAAFGATSIFSAFNSYSDKGLFFLIGSILLICAFLIWRSLNMKTET